MMTSPPDRERDRDLPNRQAAGSNVLLASEVLYLAANPAPPASPACCWGQRRKVRASVWCQVALLSTFYESQLQLTGPFREGRYRADKGSTDRSYQSTRPTGWAFQMLPAQGKKGGGRSGGWRRETPLAAGEEASASDKSKGMVQTGLREAHRCPRPISRVQILFLPLATPPHQALAGFSAKWEYLQRLPLFKTAMWQRTEWLQEESRAPRPAGKSCADPGRDCVTQHPAQGGDQALHRDR